MRNKCINSDADDEFTHLYYWPAVAVCLPRFVFVIGLHEFISRSASNMVGSARVHAPQALGL